MNQYKPGSAERQAAENELFPHLREIGRYVLRGIFGTTSKCNAYICATRHLCTCFACTGIKNHEPSDLYFCDVKLYDANEPSEPSDEDVWEPNIHIDDVHVWRMTTGLIPSLELWYDTGVTVGMRPVADANKREPMFGITNKKLVVPPHSYFVEGSHQELYEYPYYFFLSESPEVNGYPNENWKTNGTTSV